MSEPDMLSCPFCGSDQIDTFNEGQGWGAECYCCGIQTGESNWTREKVIDLWNTRTVPDDLALVPKEPTEEMIARGRWVNDMYFSDGTPDEFNVSIYKEMIGEGYSK